MQKHIKVYREFYRIGEDDTMMCSVCPTVAVDIHHITSRGLKSFEYKGKQYNDINNILNLIGLCRSCHNKAHGNIFSKDFLYGMNKKGISEWSN